MKNSHNPATRVLVIEYLSAGGRLGDDAADAELLTHQELLTLGRSMRDALAADLALLPALVATVAQQADEPVPVPPLQRVVAPSAQPLGMWLATAQQDFDAIWLVAPESDGLLAALQAAVAPSRWIGCDAAAIAIASSKRATLAAMAQAGLATPLDLAAEGQAWVVKPDDGAGALDTRRHICLDDAEADVLQRMQSGAMAVIEPWVDGEPLSLALLCGIDGAQVLTRNRQCIELDACGNVHYRGVEVGAIGPDEPRTPMLDALALRAAAALPGLRGVVGIDLVWHAQRGPVLIEINPRPTCAYAGLSAAVGFNVAAAVLADHFARWPLAQPEAAGANA